MGWWGGGGYSNYQDNYGMGVTMATVDEVNELVESGVTVPDWRGEPYVIETWDELKYELTEEGVETSLGRFFKKAEFGGMDQGTSFWLIVGLEKDGITQLFKKDGWYASHVGSELDGDLYEVESFERTVTDYRPLTG